MKNVQTGHRHKHQSSMHPASFLAGELADLLLPNQYRNTYLLDRGELPEKVDADFFTHKNDLIRKLPEEDWPIFPEEIRFRLSLYG